MNSHSRNQLIENFVIITALALSACSGNDNQNDSRKNSDLTRLFDSIEKFSASPEDSLYLGRHPRGAWASVSFKRQQVRADSLSKFASDLEHIPDSALTEQERISKTVMLMNLGDQIDAVRFKMILIPINAEGGFYNQLSYVLPQLPFATATDFRNYLAWLPRYEKILY
jgi:uncharacterized protein (DUF885 family)